MAQCTQPGRDQASDVSPGSIASLNHNSSSVPMFGKILHASCFSCGANNDNGDGDGIFARVKNRQTQLWS
eukprot:4468557-Amphidinium_carterae.3